MQLRPISATVALAFPLLSKGSPVARVYGTEVLRISPQAIDLSRVEQGGVPLLDHHRQDGIDQVLGRITDAWISGGSLMGRIKFAQTEQGRKAEGMVARKEIGALSVGYSVSNWEITDNNGTVLDPDRRGRFRVAIKEAAAALHR